MHSAGITGWLLIGMFGWGAAVGLLISIWIGRRITASRQGEAVWWEPLFRWLAALAGVVVIPLLAGLVAVILTFVAHRCGWERPLPYLAAIGDGFLLLVTIWMLWTVYKPSPARRQKRKGAR